MLTRPSLKNCVFSLHLSMFRVQSSMHDLNMLRLSTGMQSSGFDARRQNFCCADLFILFFLIPFLVFIMEKKNNNNSTVQASISDTKTCLVFTVVIFFLWETIHNSLQYYKVGHLVRTFCFLSSGFVSFFVFCSKNQFVSPRLCQSEALYA